MRLLATQSLDPGIWTYVGFYASLSPPKIVLGGEKDNVKKKVMKDWLALEGGKGRTLLFVFFGFENEITKKRKKTQDVRSVFIEKRRGVCSRSLRRCDPHNKKKPPQKKDQAEGGKKSTQPNRLFGFLSFFVISHNK